MAESLKSKLPAIGRILGETPDALYGWQRALVREALLDSVPGRGPGSGVPATPEAVAQFLIGICCHATRVENVPFAQAVTKAQSLQGGCDLTSRKTFGEALSLVLARPDLAARIQQLTINANAGGAGFIYDDNKQTLFWKPARKPAGGIQYSAMIWGPTLVEIAKEIAR